jgi:hypothetical protein
VVFKIWNAANYRRTVAGVCLVLAPLLFAAAEVIGPEPAGDARAQLLAFEEHHAALVGASLLQLLMAMVFVTAVFGLLHKLRGRGVVYGHVGGALMLYGLVVTHAGLGGVNLVFAEMSKPGMNRAAMVQLLDAFEHDHATAPLPLGHFLFVLGIILLGVALYRSRLVPRWAAWCVILFPLSDIILGTVGVDSLAAGAVSNAFSVIGFGAIGLSLLASSDASWDEVREVDNGAVTGAIAERV